MMRLPFLPVPHPVLSGAIVPWPSLGALLLSTSATVLGLVPQAWAGEVSIVTVGDSTSSGTVNFEARPESGAGIQVTTLATNGGEVQITLGGETITAVSPATAVARGIITSAEAANGIGVGGAVLTLPQSVLQVLLVSVTTSQGPEAVNIPGLTQGNVAPLTALTLAAPALQSVTVSVNGQTVSVGQVLGNLVGALNNADATIVPTTINDAAVVLRAVLDTKVNRSPAENRALRGAARSVAAMLRSVQPTIPAP